MFSELGQYPLVISAIVSSINFWLHAVQSKDNSLVNKAYREHYDNHLKSQWLNFVKYILCDLGFSHVWENQCTFVFAGRTVQSFFFSLKFASVTVEAGLCRTWSETQIAFLSRTGSRSD